MTSRRTLFEQIPEWFGPKTIGIGWKPITWQGYALVFGSVLIVFALTAAAIFFGRLLR